MLCLSACGGGDSSGTNVETPSINTPEAFSLNFKLMSGDMDVNCDNMISGFGSEGNVSVGINDLRFFVSNLQMFNDNDERLPVELDTNEFQYNSDGGSAALIDLTSNASGSCTGEAIAFGEGTARVNTVVTGTVSDGRVTRISFDVGVPQAVMKDVIATNTVEDAPSPLGELYWSWASGYRHFVANFAVMDGVGTMGEGYLHIGSRGCGGDGVLALENRDACDFINTPHVSLDNFDLNTDVVVIDLEKALAGLSFVAPVYSAEPPYEIIGEGPGVSCHSAPPESQADCGPIFSSFGIDVETGAADETENTVFGTE